MIDTKKKLEIAGEISDVIKGLPLKEAWSVIFITMCSIYGPLWLLEAMGKVQSDSTPFDNMQ